MTPTTTTSIEIASGRCTLAADSAGRGPCVVLLHAGVADRRMWRNEVAALASARPSFRAVAYDRRGHGDTLHADEPWSQTRDLAAVLDAVAPHEPAMLVGCSQGGRIAIDAALEYPSRVRALVLVAPGVSGAPAVERFPPAIEAWIARVERAEAAADVDAINAAEAHAWLDGPAAPEGRVGGAVREAFLAMNEIALRAEVRGAEAEPPPAHERLGAIACPTLVVVGDLDFPHLIELSARIGREMPRATRRVMHDVAHLPNLERPAEFDAMLLEFCALNR